MACKLQYLIVSLVLITAGTARSQISCHDDIQPIFNANCIVCHGGNSGVTLSSYESVMNSVWVQYNMNIVVAGEPDQSPIVDKIGPNPTYGQRMPEGGPFLDDDEINLIRQYAACQMSVTLPSIEIRLSLIQNRSRKIPL